MSTIEQTPAAGRTPSASDTPRVSVVIPCLNEAENIQECVNRAPSKRPPDIVVTIPCGTSSRCSISVSVVDPSYRPWSYFATADWRGISEEIWPFTQAPPATPMGEAEADWRARHQAIAA